MENMSVFEIKITLLFLSILIAVYGVVGIIRKKIWIGAGLTKFTELHSGKSAVYWGILHVIIACLVIVTVLLFE